MAQFSIKQGKKMVYLGYREWQKTPQSNPIRFVELADPEAFDKITVIADKDLELDKFTTQSFVKPEVEISNFNNRTSVTLLSMTVA